MPDTEGYFYNLYMNETGMAVCSCIIGKPAEAVADGDAKTFTASFDGHTVTAVCDQTMTLTVDGEQTAENAAECEKFTVKSGKKDVKATPHKARLTAWRHICLHLFRHLARKFLAGRQPSGVIFIQSDEKSDCASAPPALCGVA